MAGHFRRSITAIIATRPGSMTIPALLSVLEREANGSDALSDGLDIIVVVDGAEQPGDIGAWPPGRLPLQVIRSGTPGCAGAKNTGWNAASGELVWFLDDDELPVEGALLARRRLHEQLPGAAVVGPNLLVRNGPGDRSARAWFDRRHALLAARGTISDANEFSAANTSMPRSVIESVGGFPDHLRGWGYEDIVLGQRLVRARVQIVFSMECGALHAGQARSIDELAAQRREGGRNLARVAADDPDLLVQLVPAGGALRGFELFRALWRVAPSRALAMLRVGQSFAVRLARLEWSASHQRSDLLTARAASLSLLLGMLEEDPAGPAAKRKLGIDEAPTTDSPRAPFSGRLKGTILSLPGTRKVAHNLRGILADSGIVAYRPDAHSTDFWEETFGSGEWDYFVEPEESYRYSVLIGLIERFPGSPDIIDIGCGFGTLRARLAYHSFKRYVGIDVSRSALERAAGLQDEHTRFLLGDPLFLDLEPAHVVVLNEVLSVVEDPRALLRRARDLVRPGGLLLTSTWGHRGDRALLRMIDREFIRVDRITIRSSLRHRSPRGWTVTCHMRGID
jgi:GT2 family glycosyltransferase